MYLPNKICLIGGVIDVDTLFYTEEVALIQYIYIVTFLVCLSYILMSEFYFLRSNQFKH